MNHFRIVARVCRPHGVLMGASRFNCRGDSLQLFGIEVSARSSHIWSVDLPKTGQLEVFHLHILAKHCTSN